jgi:hypothetical protein
MLDPDVRRVLDGTSIAHLATVLPDGSPHSTPVYVGTQGDRIIFFTGPGMRKARNLRRDPRLALSIAPVDISVRARRRPGPGRRLDRGRRRLGDHWQAGRAARRCALPARTRARRARDRARTAELWYGLTHQRSRRQPEPTCHDAAQVHAAAVEVICIQPLVRRRRVVTIVCGSNVDLDTYHRQVGTPRAGLP